MSTHAEVFEDDAPGRPPVERRLARTDRRIDVTDLDASAVQAFARDNVETDAVSLEHRGARTYLVVEG